MPHKFVMEEEKLEEGRQQAATKMILQASSPDEVALVKYAQQLGLELIERDRHSIQLKNPQGVYENYRILANFPFSSKDKKMSVLVTQEETGKTIYYVKGAEVVLESMVKAG
jgi:phospholipid-translocating ATPase